MRHQSCPRLSASPRRLPSSCCSPSGLPRSTSGTSRSRPAGRGTRPTLLSGVGLPDPMAAGLEPWRGACLGLVANPSRYRPLPVQAWRLVRGGRVPGWLSSPSCRYASSACSRCAGGLVNESPSIAWALPSRRVRVCLSGQGHPAARAARSSAIRLEGDGPSRKPLVSFEVRGHRPDQLPGVPIQGRRRRRAEPRPGAPWYSVVNQSVAAGPQIRNSFQRGRKASGSTSSITSRGWVEDGPSARWAGSARSGPTAGVPPLFPLGLRFARGRPVHRHRRASRSCRAYRPGTRSADQMGRGTSSAKHRPHPAQGENPDQAGRGRHAQIPGRGCTPQQPEQSRKPVPIAAGRTRRNTERTSVPGFAGGPACRAGSCRWTQVGRPNAASGNPGWGGGAGWRRSPGPAEAGRTVQ